MTDTSSLSIPSPIKNYYRKTFKYQWKLNMKAGYDTGQVPNNILHERVMGLSKEKGLNAFWNNQLLL